MLTRTGVKEVLSLTDCWDDTIVKNVAGLLVILLASWPAQILEPFWLEIVTGACKITVRSQDDHFHIFVIPLRTRTVLH